MTDPKDERIYTAIDIHDRRGFRSQLRVVAIKWKGRHKIHVRDFYLGEDGTFFAGRGIAFDPAHLDRLIYGLQLVRDDFIGGRLTDDGLEQEPQDSGI